MPYQIANTNFGSFIVDDADQVISQSLLNSGDFETSHIELVINFLENKYARKSQKKVFIDIGANIGTHIIAALNKYEFKRGLAFEPCKRNFTILRSNISLNNLCSKSTLVNAGVGDADALLELSLNTSNYGDHRVSNNFNAERSKDWADSHLFDHIENIRICEPTPFITSEIDEYDLIDSLCWIDTQGYEVAILSSLKKFIENGLPVMIEFWPYGMICQGHTFESFINAAWSDSLEYHQLKEDGSFSPLSRDSLASLWEQLCREGDAKEAKYLFTNILITTKYHPELMKRIIMTSKCRDADSISKVKYAGRIDDSGGIKLQVMHNGLKVVEGCYYGEWMSEVIKRCRGHHEPQEEKAFEIINNLIGDSGFMIELGCFWAYYSLWFLSKSRHRSAVGLEPEPDHIKFGLQNAEINHLNHQMTFIHGACAPSDNSTINLTTEKSGNLTLKGYTVQELLRLSNIDLLHCDTQGCEEFVADQVLKLAESGLIRFCFFSTHAYEITGNPLTHQQTLEKLQNFGAWIICEHDVFESFSGDGLIVASFMPLDRGLRIEISTNRYSKNIFKHPSIHHNDMINN